MTKAEILSGVEKPQKAKILTNNTVEYWQNGNRIIRLYNTDILVFKKNGNIVINTGGYWTMTTRRRINEYLPIGEVISDRGKWYSKTGWTDNKHRIPFYDGLQITKDGDPVRAGLPKKEIQRNKRVTRLKKYLSAFLAHTKKVIKDKGVPVPNAGDCWYCNLRDKSGETMGDFTKNTNHLLQHLRQRYLHGSLILNSLIFAGYRNPALIMEMKNEISIVCALRKYFKAKLQIN